MVVEDSDETFPALAVVHSLCNACDTSDSTLRLVHATFHELDNTDKVIKVLPFRCLERVALEERNNNVS